MENDVYFYDVQSKASTRVTDDGKTNLHYNGIPDWVYEGSIISIDGVKFCIWNAQRKCLLLTMLCGGHLMVSNSSILASMIL